MLRARERGMARVYVLTTTPARTSKRRRFEIAAREGSAGSHLRLVAVFEQLSQHGDVLEGISQGPDRRRTGNAVGRGDQLYVWRL